jgi:hypothetical protein
MRRCPSCLGGPDACLCHRRGDPAWDRHIAGRAALLAAETAPHEPLAPTDVVVDPSCSRELVVARHREPLGWLADVPFPVRVYDSGPTPPGPLPSHVRHVRKPDVGREAHAYLMHIVGRYHALAALTIFCQADPFEHSPDFLARIRHDYDRPTSLTLRYQENTPPAAIKALDRVEWVHGHEVRYGLATARHVDRRTPSRPWLNEEIWGYVFDCHKPDPWWFGYGNCWAVPRASIRARTPAFWAWLMREVERAGDGPSSWSDPPLNPWMFEAIASYLWSDPAEYPHRADRVERCGCGGQA